MFCFFAHGVSNSIAFIKIIEQLCNSWIKTNMVLILSTKFCQCIWSVCPTTKCEHKRVSFCVTHFIIHYSLKASLFYVTIWFEMIYVTLHFIQFSLCDTAIHVHTSWIEYVLHLYFLVWKRALMITRNLKYMFSYFRFTYNVVKRYTECKMHIYKWYCMI